MIGADRQRIAANAAFANGLFVFGHIDLRVDWCDSYDHCSLKFNFYGFLLKISLKPTLLMLGISIQPIIHIIYIFAISLY